MKAYTISRLARDADVSVHIIRDYELRGLLRPCKCTENGYRIYDKPCLQRLRFILAGKKAGLSLGELEYLCKAMDDSNTEHFQRSVTRIRELLALKIGLQRKFGRQLSTLLPRVSCA